MFFPTTHMKEQQPQQVNTLNFSIAQLYLKRKPTQQHTRLPTAHSTQLCDDLCKNVYYCTLTFQRPKFCTPFIESWTRITIWLKPTLCNSIISIVQSTQGAECGAMEEGRPAKSLIKLWVHGAWSNKTVERLDKNLVWTRAQ